jgi:hypothetical protein
MPEVAIAMNRCKKSTQLILAAYLYGICQSMPAFAQNPSPGLNQSAANSINPQAALARNQALLSKKIAGQASRKAITIAEQASDQVTQNGAGNPDYYVEINSDGYLYQGIWRKVRNFRVYNGLGILSWPNHNRYAGMFAQGHRNGSGVFTGPNGDRYEGEWRGEIQGHGKYSYPDGDRYEGEFVNGVRQGYGVMIYANGEQYQGAWSNNQKSGFGVQINRRGEILYAGNW